MRGLFRRSQLLASASLAIVCQAHAALPPDAQRRSEFMSVLAAAAEVPQMRMVTTIEFVAADRYRVRAGDCAMDVRIIYLPQRLSPQGVPLVGPASFTAIPGEPVCR